MLKDLSKNACQRMGTPLVEKKQGWELPVIPHCVQPLLGDKPRRIIFSNPAPEGIEYVGRNYPLVEGLARYLFEEALESTNPTASRCGVTVTKDVSKPTFILLLRLRHLLETTGNDKQYKPTTLAEECLIRGFTGTPNNPQWLSQTDTLALLAKVTPTGDLSLERQQEWIEKVLQRLDDLEHGLKVISTERANVLLESYRRVRKVTKEGQVKVIPQLPMDIFGVYVLLPD